MNTSSALNPVFINVLNGNSVLPEKNVSNTTEKAPNCNPITADIIEAMNIFHSLFNNSRIANGEVPPPIREEIISDFKKGYFQILIAGIESMGTGHSLQNCRNVIVTDYGYTASGLDQAVYRVCRINSERNINIIKLYVKNSIEENRQLDLIDKKRESSEMLLDYSSNYNFQTIKL